MSLDTQTILKRRRYEELMQAGREAYKQGNRRLAHDHWREAAIVDPYNEQVWLALYHVVETDEDRIACLNNIIAINPMNIRARERLRAFQEQAEAPRPAARAAATKTAATTDRRSSTSKTTARRKPSNKKRAKRQSSSTRRLRYVLLILLLVVVVVLLVLVATGALPVGALVTAAP